MDHSYFGVRKKWIQAICMFKKMDHSYFKPEKKFCSNLERKISSSQIVGARKKTMTAISRQKNCFAAIWKDKNFVHKALEEEKRG